MALPEVSSLLCTCEVVGILLLVGGGDPPFPRQCGPPSGQVCDRLSWISAYAVGYGAVGCAVGDPGTRKSSGMSHKRGLSSPTLGYLCAGVHWRCGWLHPGVEWLGTAV